jgi:glutaredoxin
MEKLSGNNTVPQIFINNKAIGGFDDLSLLNNNNELKNLLK